MDHTLLTILTMLPIIAGVARLANMMRQPLCVSEDVGELDAKSAKYLLRLRLLYETPKVLLACLASSLCVQSFAVLSASYFGTLAAQIITGTEATSLAAIVYIGCRPRIFEMLLLLCSLMMLALQLRAGIFPG